ncbi:MAG: PAS domain S-box protein [Anaerolineae bacterium]|nr:PAS domain S-box protein [Anaerolineae bacterium]
MEKPEGHWWHGEPTWFDVGVILIVLLLSALCAYYFWHQTESETLESVLDNAQRAAHAIDLAQVNALSGTADDLNNPQYLRLKEQFKLTQQLFPNCHALYLLGMRQDGTVFFYIDSDPVHVNREASAGQVYAHAPDQIVETFNTAALFVGEHVLSDEGDQISAFVPITDQQHAGRVAAVVGMDITADHWHTLVWEQARLPIVLAILFGLSTSAAYFLMRRDGTHTHFNRKRPLGLRLETLITLIIGAQLTCLLGWIAYHQNVRAKQADFDALASAYSGSVSSYLQNLDNVYLESLTSFFNASVYVDLAEFEDFTEPYSRDSRVLAWLWVQHVEANKRPQIELSMRNYLETPFEMWEMDAQGQPVTANVRDDYYPILYIAPLEGNEFALGFDFASNPKYLAAIDKMMRSGLATTVDPAVLFEEARERVGILILRPVTGGISPNSQKGFVAAALRPKDVVHNTLKVVDCQNSLYVDLYQMRSDGPPLLLASNAPQYITESHQKGNLIDHPHALFTNLIPIHAFGEVYTLVIHPNDSNDKPLPGSSVWGVIAFGACLTILLALLFNGTTIRREELEKKIAQRTAELTMSEKKYRNLAETVKAVIWEYDTHQNGWSYLAPQVEELTGWKPQDLPNRQAWMDRIHPDDRETVLAKSAKYIAEGLDFENEYRLVKPDGAFVWIHDVIRFIYAQDGSVTLLGFMIDISARKTVEQALSESENQYRELFESESDAIMLIDDESGRLLQANRAACEIYGYSLEELLALGITDLCTEPKFSFAATRQSRPLINEPIKIPLSWHKRKDGTRFPVEITGRTFMRENRVVHIAAIRDITDRMKFEDELRLQSAALESAANAIVITDLDGRIEWANPAFSRLTGYEISEVVGKNPSDLIKSGLHDDALYQQLWDTILAGEVWSGELTNRRKDGTFYVEEMTITPVRSSDGAIAHFIAVKQDVTERKQHAREQDAIVAVVSSLRDFTDPAKIYQVVVKEVSELVNAHGTAIMMHDHVNHNGDIPAAWGEFGKRFKEHVSIDESIYDRLVKDKTPMVFADIKKERNGVRSKAFEAAPAVAVIPLIVEQEVIGALWAGRQVPFRPDEVRILNAVADIIASAVHRANLLQATLQQVDQLTSLRAIDHQITNSSNMHTNLEYILTQVKTHLAVDAVAIFLLDPETQILRFTCGSGFRNPAIEHCYLNPGESLAGIVIEDQAPLFIQQLSLSPYVSSIKELLSDGFVSYYAYPLIVMDQAKGVIEVLKRTPLNPNQGWLRFYELLAGQTAIVLDNAQMFSDIERAHDELVKAYDATIEGWSRAMDLRDKETEGHTQRVTEMTLELARAAGIPETELIHIRRGSLLHDIGKLGVPDHILLKPDKLTDAEWFNMRLHPVHAYNMLKDIDYLKPALEIPYCHHEKWDGTGYPRGLKGEEIPLEARIFAVVDVYDAVTSDRPYRPAWSRKKALEHIRENSGQHFDPKVVELFLSVMGEKDPD